VSFLAVLIQNAVGSGTGGVGSGPDELAEVSVTPLRNDPDINMIIFPFMGIYAFFVSTGGYTMLYCPALKISIKNFLIVYCVGKGAVGGAKLAVYRARPLVMRKSCM
jgi:hypothetical protein